MELIITIDMDNAAFEDYPSEVGRILAGVAQDLYYVQSEYAKKLFDTNGNSVGQAVVSDVD